MTWYQDCIFTQSNFARYYRIVAGCFWHNDPRPNMPDGWMFLYRVR